MEKNGGHSIKFRYIASQILATNIEFFQQKITEENLTYFCTVKMSYHFKDSLAHSLDLGTMPTLKKSTLQNLTEDQQQYLFTSGRNIEKEPAKLISVHEKDCQTSDFIVSLLYMVTHHSCQIVEVLSIVEYECADLFSPWVDFLGKKRAQSSSNLEGKICKNLGENQMF